jgi:hypothetical protein
MRRARTVSAKKKRKMKRTLVEDDKVVSFAEEEGLEAQAKSLRRWRSCHVLRQMVPRKRGGHREISA